MSFAIELYFDPATETAIRQIWQMLAEAGLPATLLEANYVPHISLAVSSQVELAGLDQALARLAAKTSPLAFSLANIGIFPTTEAVVFLGVTVNQALLALHTEFYQQASPYLSQPLIYYKPDNWIPHCTLSYGLNLRTQMNSVLQVCLEKLHVPLQGQLTHIGLSKVTPVSYQSILKYEFTTC
jgi:2'-5' RNA ligase